MTHWPHHLQHRLNRQRAQGNWREREVRHRFSSTVEPFTAQPFDRSFGSNDYLGLSRHPVLKETLIQATALGMGSTGSPLLSGYHRSHALFEKEAAAFVGQPKALLLSSGYLANLAILTALLQPGDRVFADRLNHASLNDGCRLSGARLKRFRHNDLNHLKQLIESNPANPGQRTVIVTEGLFSMDGDCPPINELLALAEAIDALVMVDEAHSFGILGPQGQGLIAAQAIKSDRLIQIFPLGKAAGLSGAFIGANETIIETVIQFARPYIYETALPVFQAEALRVALSLIQEANEARERLQEHIALFRSHVQANIPVNTSWQSPIQPYLIGDNEKAIEVSHSLQQKGCWVPAIRPPTVPVGEARLRISLSASHSREDIQHLIDALTTLSF